MNKNKEWQEKHAREMKASVEVSKKLLEALLSGDANHNDWWEQCLKDSGKNGLTEKAIVFHAVIPILAAIGMSAHQVIEKEKENEK